MSCCSGEFDYVEGVTEEGIAVRVRYWTDYTTFLFITPQIPILFYKNSK